VPASFDVLIIGGGAVGAACAREMARTGRRVGVLDRREDRGDAWRAAAGMLAPQIEARQDDPLFELGLVGRERYRDLSAELLESTGIDVGLWQEGILRVALDETDVAESRATAAWQRQQGHVCDWLDAAEIAARWPWLAPVQGGLWAPHEGALRPERLVAALLADAERHGAQLVRDEAVALESAGDRVTGARGRERYAAGAVVLAAGAWSGRLRGLPRPVSVEPVRGQMAALPWPGDVPRAIVYNRDCYIVARDDEAVIGSTMEYTGFDVGTTSAGLGRVFARASALCPVLSTLELKRTWSGLRPMTPDARPIIGREPALDGLWYATGHGRNGILLAGITGMLIRQLIDGEEIDEDLTAVSPERFWRW
jgi:glycine oxidase